MRNAKRASVTGVVLAAMALLAANLPANAEETARPLEMVPMDRAVTAPDLIEETRRGLGLTRQQAMARYTSESRAVEAELRAKRVLGDSFGGAWFDAATGRLVVHTTDVEKAAPLRGPDIEVRAVSRSLAQLDGIKAEIDALAGKGAPSAISGWYAAIQDNDVVVEVNRAAFTPEAKDFLARATAIAKAVRVLDVVHSPRLYADVIGGYPFYINRTARCSIGFAVTVGFVTAGHCGQRNSVATDFTGQKLGTFAGSVFPGRDFAYVRTVSGTRLYGYVYGYNGYYYPVQGSMEMPVGTAVCRSGSTTGMWCGTILAKNQTVNYPQGTVYGLTRTNVCAEPGDSGGSWLSHNEAQGVTSGGAGNCSTGGITFFQPVNPILSYYRLTLVRA